MNINLDGRWFFFMASLLIHSSLLFIGLNPSQMPRRASSFNSPILAKSSSQTRLSYLSLPKTIPKTLPELSKDSLKKISDPKIKQAQEKTVFDDQLNTSENHLASTETSSVNTEHEVENYKNKYFSLIAQTIYQHKRYPRQAYSLYQEGLVVVRLKLDKMGRIIDLQVIEDAPYKSLTQASLETIKRIRQFPPIPDELGMSDITFRIPIEYKIQI